MAFDPHAYTITVKRMLVDGENLFRATVAELPDVDAYSEKPEDAYAMVIEALESLHAQHVEQGRTFPPPLEEEGEFSGRVTLRMGKSLHRKAALFADYEGVSLNQFLVTAIAERVGAVTGQRAYMIAEGSWDRMVSVTTVGRGVPFLDLSGAYQSAFQHISLNVPMLTTRRGGSN